MPPNFAILGTVCIEQKSLMRVVSETLEYPRRAIWSSISMVYGQFQDLFEFVEMADFEDSIYL